MLTLTFTAHLEPDGRLAVICHDDMADIATAPLEPFLEKHADLVKNVKRKLLQYAQSLFRPDEVSAEDEQSRPSDTFPITDNGFPIIPDMEDLNGLRKKDLELKLRTYLGQHYRLFLLVSLIRDAD